MKIIPDTAITDLLCQEQLPEPCGLVIFGASGDLTRRKLLPAVFHLHRRGLLPERFFLLGFARSAKTDAAFREEFVRALPAGEAAAARAFAGRLFYQAGTYDDQAACRALADRLAALDQAAGTDGNLLFYLATPPELVAPIVGNLAPAGLLREVAGGGGWRRVVFEKPFGHDRASARAVDGELRRHLAEGQIYRIDHYLGKETVQNLFMLRFANLIFEPLWNNRYIDQVQITAAETVGIEHRAGYFERTGLVRDMFQNHLLQLLALTAMEPPTSFAAEAVLAAKNQVLESVRPFAGREEIGRRCVRGQYVAGGGHPGYREEEGVAPGSATETYAAAQFFIDNWRWGGVPFYLRSGKRLPVRRTEIAVVFKPVPFSIFAPLQPTDLARNVLVLNVQPDEGIELTIQAKRPGPKLCMSRLTLDVKYREVFQASPPEAYERLLHDAMLGDRTLFIPATFIDHAWRLLDPVLECWAEPCCQAESPLHPYPAGGWGPAAAEALLRRDGRGWRND
ncbi:MAG: glucose-6-phosphate dehydrogenase [Lentisphaeria bacterium]|jgi:glucose-6-phosphate 1-dehydrogenase